MNNDIYSQLHKEILKLLSDYSKIYEQVKNNNDWKNPFRDIIGKTIPQLLQQCADITDPYMIVGGYGKGRWTAVPWIAVFDKRITTSAQKGVYIVYLLNKDTKELFLTFEIAATEVMGTKTNADGNVIFTGVVGKHDPQVKKKLQARADEIRYVIKDDYFTKDNKIKSGSEGYDSGAVYYKRYSLNNLPDGKAITGDLKRMMTIYQRYYTWITTGSENFENNQDDNKGGEEEVVVSVKKSMDETNSYIKAKGFNYSPHLIENFYLSLKSKPFVLLAGTSGTGKTRLVKLFAESIGATESNGRYKMVSVRPDWSDSSDLFGHVNLSGKFVPGALTDFVLAASKDPEKPYFLCLDEMNLARVEYYFSDVLSVIETRDFVDDDPKKPIVTSSILKDSDFGDDEASRKKYSGLQLPENLYIVGTVNMDETTFPFSRKVLDRANTIEFSDVNLTAKFGETTGNLEPQEPKNDFLRSEYLILQQCVNEADDVTRWCDKLEAINRVLRSADSHVGYRVRDEIVFYMLNNKHAELLTENEAMDFEIMQKILPRIKGSSRSVKEMLCELYKICAREYEGLQMKDNNVGEKMQKHLEGLTCDYPLSAAKIAFMVRRYEEDGFTSYWI